ncbi:hypothetical protein K5549_002588 [Capra hircus]|uniref:Uncharacterized protein n=1 Tax=Capra hircus TaxID=9925 RepID=A0A452EA15_CAPHI|nr:hypothetical protein K5549_002588 [Capra hircus]
MPGEQQIEEYEMVLPVKREEDEGEKYDVVTLKIPVDHKEVSSKLPLSLNCSLRL